ncbi:hypothetical protein PENTCL1PPCAC_9578, partial [Pristionchus entomophagus]
DPLSVRDEIFQIIKRTNYRDTDGCNIGTSPFFSNSREVTRIEEGRFRSVRSGHEMRRKVQGKRLRAEQIPLGMTSKNR